MRFNSLEFYILLLSVFVVYYAIPVRFRGGILLVTSCVFYMAWRPEYILLILFSVGVDYGVAMGMERFHRTRARKLLLFLSLASNLGLLVFFKYVGLIADSLRKALAILHLRVEIPDLEILLPVGISFYTFQALSYTIDVYRGTTRAERSFTRLFLYVMFFPQLVAGPIERSTHLLPQFSKVVTFDYSRVSSGFRLILWGLIKKVAIADRLALLVDPVFDHVEAHSGLLLLLATYGFAFQIYADFSAYSDIARGSARVLGFDLTDNFNSPYTARSIPEFWRRWHISLSTWFRDYVYIPLGGNRKGPVCRCINLMVTFILSGVWHGANWTFVVWGAYHGLFYIVSVLTRDRMAKLGRRFGLPACPGWLQSLATFHIVLVGWVFFRAGTVGEAAWILSQVGTVHSSAGISLSLILEQIPLLVALVLLLVVDLQRKREPFDSFLGRWPVLGRWSAYVVGALLLLNVPSEVAVPFIYFQF